MPDLVRVWRVENAIGEGPYKSHGWEHIAESDFISPRWPRHGVINLPEDIRFAFQSKRDLLAWFNVDELRTLIRVGFKVRSWLVDSKYVIPGNKQVALRVPFERL